jgi:glyoxylase-like metal-dependent hydrolase (beta-lactamase superfamily II)
MAMGSVVAAAGDGRVTVVKCGQLGTNTSFIENTQNGEVALIDAPFGSFEAAKKILPSGARVISLLFTHGHWDHIGDAYLFREAGARTHAHALDRPMIEHTDAIGRYLGAPGNLIPCPIDGDITDGAVVTVGDWLTISCRWVPGHSPGGLAFYVKSLGCVFCGDTLFRGCIGRSDLPGGDEGALISAIGEKILPLPDDTIVIPGHGAFTTVGNEKATNDYLR